MPRYDYDCSACGRRFEVIHGVHADPPGSCPLCGSGPIRKAFAPPTIVFKGSGWAKKERRAASTTKSTDSDAPGADTRTDKASTAGDAKGKASGAGEQTSSTSGTTSKAPPPSSTSTD